MHTEIEYTGDIVAKDEKAIADIKEWLGVAKFNQLTKEFEPHVAAGMTFESFANYVSLAGISGYPVKAWARLLKIEGV